MKSASVEATQAGKTDCKILVIGHSHSVMLQSNLREHPDPSVTVINLRAEENDALLEGRGPGDALGAEYRPAHLFSMIGGNSHYQVGLLEHAEKLQFLQNPEDQALDPDRTLVTQAMMRRLLQRWAEPHLEMLNKLKAIFDLPVTHILPPPPLSIEDITPYLPPTFSEVNKYGVVPPALRLRLYQLQCDIFREHCAQSEIAVIEPPKAAIDRLGFLKSSYRGRNATHASAKYGSLVLEQIHEAVNG